MAIEQSSSRYQIDNVAQDISVLKHILENGTKGLFENKISTQIPADQSIMKADKLNYNQMTESEISRLDFHFNDFKQFYEMFWSQIFPEPSQDAYEPNEFNGTLSQSQFNAVYQGILEYGSWRFADKVQSGLSNDDTAAAMFSIIKTAKQTIAEFGNDVFNLPQTQNFTYQGYQSNSSPVLKSYFKMFLIENHVKSDRFRLPKNYFEIADFASAWGYIQDVRLLLQAKLNGLQVSKWDPSIIEKIVCDAHINTCDLTKSLQSRLENLCVKLQSISSTVIMEKLNEDGLHTNIQFDQSNDQQLEEKEAELVRRFEQSGSQFPIQKDVRTSFQIELQQKLFK